MLHVMMKIPNIFCVANILWLMVWKEVVGLNALQDMKCYWSAVVRAPLEKKCTNSLYIRMHYNVFSQQTADTI